METSTLTQFFLAFATTTLGTFLGALGNKLVTYNSQTKWKWAFYLLGIFSLVSLPLYLLISGTDNLLFIDYFTLLVLGISAICLIAFTAKFLDRKFIFKTSELDSIINKFTSLSDHNEIRLFGGDLNFFGNGPHEMDQNSQYNHLKSIGFKKISILCEEPRDVYTKIRYGKILYEVNGATLKFYNPDEADLLIRGRMKTIQGVEKLMIYAKIESGKYQTIETDTANSNGALYNNIWKLIWSQATPLDNKQKEEYVHVFRNGQLR